MNLPLAYSRRFLRRALLGFSLDLPGSKVPSYSEPVKHGWAEAPAKSTRERGDFEGVLSITQVSFIGYYMVVHGSTLKNILHLQVTKYM